MAAAASPDTVKVEVSLFGIAQICAHLYRSPDGEPLVHHVIWNFPDRPSRPHATLHAPDGRYPCVRPHVTAGHGRRDVDRRYLAEVPNAVFEAGALRMAQTAYREFYRGLRAVDRDTIEREGWHAHGFHAGVVRRWILQARDFVVDARTVLVFVRHVLRHHVPGASTMRESDGFLYGPVLRSDASGLHGAALMFFPYGAPIEMPPSASTPWLARGWYLREFPREPEAWNFDDVLPADRVEEMLAEIRQFLADYPRRAAEPNVEALFEGVPAVLSGMLGMFQPDLLDFMMQKKERARPARPNST